ncbi:MAG: hypothetical protein OEV36_03530 [Myxococcales bacterium]|nr:hypothetical protein [Myxococcales bacterium]
MKPLSLTPFILFFLAVALPACQGGEPTSVGMSSGALVSPPASCGAGYPPTCNIAADYPEQIDLTTSNSQNIFYSTPDGALTLQPGSGSLADSDSDGVPDPADECAGPGWRLPCDGDASNDGIYQTLYYNALSDVTVRADVDVSGKIEKADAYILMDATGSMGGEQLRLVTDLTSGTFVDPADCPGGAGTGILGGLECAIPDLWIGVGDFKEVSYPPHDPRYDMAPYHHYLDTTDNIQHVLDAVSNLVADNNDDYPEAHTQALYSVVTGQGLGDLVPNRGACPSTPAGRWGYPCFRPNVLPIIILITDADMWNGPVATNGHIYGNPPFNGVLGMGVRLPPVEQSPNVLYSNDPTTAWDLGDLTNKSLTVMGSNRNFGNNATTWNVPPCKRCSGSCWGDGRDAFLKFSLTGSTDMFVSGQGSAYNTTNVALLNSGLGFVQCNGGPGSGDYWGRLTQNLGAGDWYAVSDAAVSPSSSVAQRVGNFQLRLHNLTADPGGYPSWQTADLPLDWTTVETELLATGVKFVNIVSPNAAGYIAIPDVEALAVATNSLDQYGDPYLEMINGDGSGLSTAILDAVRSLVGDTRRDITLKPEDNPSSPTVDETGFVTAVTATTCPTTGLNNCLGGVGTSSCEGCLADTQVAFSFRLGNDFVAPAVSPQVFDFDMIAIADGTAELTRVPVRVMIPEVGGAYGAGFYENTYDSDVVCEMPPERPDWGTLEWTGSTPSDSKVTFEFFTGDSVAELGSQIPVSLTYPTDTTAQIYDIGNELIAGGKPNYMPYLRIRARLQASTDSLSTPIFQGWSTEFNCVPFD